MFNDLLLFRSARDGSGDRPKAADGGASAILSRLAVLILSAGALAAPLLLTAGRTAGPFPA